MSRRLAVAAAIFGFAIPAPASAEVPALISPTWLLDYSGTNPVIDFRPAVNVYGSRIVFERTFFDTKTMSFSDGPHLTLAELSTKTTQPLIKDGNPFGITQSARADWCWAPGGSSVARPIAFSVGNGVEINQGNGVYIVDPDTFALSFVPGSVAAIYPTWHPTCKVLAVDAFEALPYSDTSGSETLVTRGPQTQRINPANGAQQKVLSGSTLWAGFPNINPAYPALVAFAGQQFTSSGYDQDKNYVYVADTSANPPRVTPLDPHAPTNTYDPKYEGRAPTWSPDGKWIAFESDRVCGTKDPSNPAFALYLQDAKGSMPARRLTSCVYDAQHAKWFASPVNGRTLILASLLRFPGAKSPAVRVMRGIASLDVTDIVAPPAAKLAAAP